VARRRKLWGWGFEDEQPSDAELRSAAEGLAAHLGFGSIEPERPAPPRLAPPRVAVPRALADVCAADDHARALHGHGSAYVDVVRAFRGEIAHAPDAVALPRDEDDLRLVLEWCADAGLSVTPYGGGTSVVGGVDPIPGPGHAGALSLDLARMDALLDVDSRSQAARVQAGASGPRLEAQLARHGLTARFYPQSFQHSTVGGWLATRAAGHYATGETHVEDIVESVRALTVAGEVWESLRVPASGAGPSPDRLLLGSEGTLAVITSAWLRVRTRPAARRAATVAFPTFAAGCDAVRRILQAGLRPANCRLLEAEEARVTGAGDGSAALLLLGFEDVVEPLERALELCAGGTAEERSGSSLAWREAFLRAPYLRDTFVAMGVLCETFETAVTWDKLPGLVAAVQEAAGTATCRLTHAYPDGAAPYFTVLAPAARGAEVEQWRALKTAVSDAILAAGGTITHHHAVGREHARWWARQRPEPFAAALRAAKSVLDPDGLLNPGVLWGP
jgi:alkyldihydroxyacetonephosphate synthase